MVSKAKTTEARRAREAPANIAAIPTRAATRDVICLRASQTFGEIRRWIASHAPGSAHQGYPIVDDAKQLVGVLTRRLLLDMEIPDDRPLGQVIHSEASVTYSDSTLREAADLMVAFDVGRLPVVDHAAPRKVIGLLTRGDVLSAHRKRLVEVTHSERSIDLRKLRLKLRRSEPQPVEAAQEPAPGA